MRKQRVVPQEAAATAQEAPTLRFEIPGPDEPGFIRRQREATQHVQALKAGGLASMDAMIAFLLRFVAEPVDRHQARELLLDLSRTEYNALLQAVLQENEDFLSPQRRSAPSAPGTAD